MPHNEEIIKQINETITNNDTEGIERIIGDIAKNFNYQKFDWIENIFLGTELSDKTKIKFLLNAIGIREKIDSKDQNLFHRQVIPHLLLISIKNNEEEFLNLVNNEPEMQEMLTKFIKQEPSDSMEIWPLVSNLPLVKKEILEDEDFISREYRNEEDFFENLPQEYAYLICYYNTPLNDTNYYYMQSLYDKYFKNILSEAERDELIAFYFYNSKVRNGMNVSPKDTMQPLNFVLKGILNDSEFMKDLKSFQYKTNMKFIQTGLFAYNYKDIYNELKGKDDIDSNLKEKIVYLSQRDKVKGINSLEQLANTSITELENMENETIYVSGSVSAGGPQSKTLERIFPDSSSREVRRIDYNGNTKRKVVRNQESHEGIVAEIYIEDVNFPDDCITAWQRSIESAKQISSTTLVIENEQCYMFMPSNISSKQTEKCITLIDSAKKSGEFGIAVYDNQRDKTYIASMYLLDKEKAKSFIARLNEKTMKESNKGIELPTTPNSKQSKEERE